MRKTDLAGIAEADALPLPESRRAARARGRLRSWVPLVLAAVMGAGLLAGCEQRSAEPGDSVSSPESTETVVTGMVGAFSRTWGGTVTRPGGVTIMADAPKVDSQARPAHPGNVVLYCVVEITNGGDGPFDYRPVDFALFVQKGVSAGGVLGEHSDLLTTVSEPPLLAGTLEPGGTIRGAVAFEVSPSGVSTVEQLMFGHADPPGGTWTAVWRD
jgi:hypothetical protein